MDLNELYELQYKLDKEVFRKAGITAADKIQERKLALIVELSEMINEYAGFKYWKHHHTLNERALWEEWADVLHFALSLGNSFDYRIKENQLFQGAEIKCAEELHNTLLDMLYMASKMESRYRYIDFMSCLLKVGKYFGMSEEDMKIEYIKKNQINYQRIANKY